MPPKLPPHVVLVRNKTGREYLYWQKGRGANHTSARVRLPDDPSAPEFWSRYAELEQLPPPQVKTDTVRALVSAWQDSPDWRAMKPRTQVEWTRHSRRIVEAWGNLEVKGIEPKHVLTLRDAWSSMPATANLMLDVLTAMMRWSVPRGWRADNPCREIKRLPRSEGYAPWPWEAIAEAASILRPDLAQAVALALYTGQRKDDLLHMRWSAINSGGLIAVKQGKTGRDLSIPLHRDLRAVLEATPRTAVTILTSSEGTPWRSGFQATWRKHRPPLVRELGLVFHGLRKSAVVTLLEVGCSDAEVAAITGQSRKMVEHYAKRVNQEKLARTAILKWETATVNTTVNIAGTLRRK